MKLTIAFTLGDDYVRASCMHAGETYGREIEVTDDHDRLFARLVALVRAGIRTVCKQGADLGEIELQLDELPWPDLRARLLERDWNKEARDIAGAYAMSRALDEQDGPC